MTTSRDGFAGIRLNVERVAYWYFRLNGFLQIENFVVHPSKRGGQRTDADLLAVRFPHRAERLFDDPNDTMRDDETGLSLSRQSIDVVIAEIKTNQPCTLNGPWTRPDAQNVQRVLAAIGCLRPDQICDAAGDIYRRGAYLRDRSLRIRLVSVGRNRSRSLEESYPDVTQIIWRDLLTFIWERFNSYQKQKRQVDQWDLPGRQIKQLANQSYNAVEFAEAAMRAMGVQHGDSAG